jgi:hypothetical protein
MECSKKLSHAIAPLNEPSDQIDLPESVTIGQAKDMYHDVYV